MDAATAAPPRRRSNKRLRTDHSDDTDSLSMAVRALPSAGVLIGASAPIRGALLAHCATTVTKLFKPVPALISKQLSETRALNKLKELKVQGKIPKSMAKPHNISIPTVPGDDGKAKLDLIDKKANAEKLDILINTRAAKLNDILRQIAATRNETLAILKSEIDSAGAALQTLQSSVKDGKDAKDAHAHSSFVANGFSPMDINVDNPSVYSQQFVKAVVDHCSTAWDCQIQTVILSLTAKQGAEERRKAHNEAKRQSAAVSAADSSPLSPASASSQSQSLSNFQGARKGSAQRAHQSAGHRKSRSRGNSSHRSHRSTRGGHHSRSHSRTHTREPQHGQHAADKRDHTPSQRGHNTRGRGRGRGRTRGRGRGRGKGSQKFSRGHSQGKH